MKKFVALCECGQTTEVTSAQAGALVPCTCGLMISVPRLSLLQEAEATDETSKSSHELNRFRLFAAVAIAALLLGWLLGIEPKTFALIIPIGMILVGKIWLLGLMFREVGFPAILTFLTPIFDWCFLFIRFDVSWRPVLLQIIGLISLVFGARLVTPL